MRYELTVKVTIDGPDLARLEHMDGFVWMQRQRAEQALRRCIEKDSAFAKVVGIDSDVVFASEQRKAA
jgi:hypothetical protein